MYVYFCVTLLCFVANAAALYPGLCKLDSENACRDYSSAEKCSLTNYCKINFWSKTVISESNICQMCKADIANLEKFVSAKTTKDFVKYDLLALCRLCPFSSGKNECRILIDENFDKIYNDVVAKLDPNTVCRGLHLCTDAGRHEIAKEMIAAKMKESLGFGLIAPGPAEIENEICFTEQKCSNYATAKQCGVLDLCKEYVWSVPVKSDPMCDECKQEIKKVHDLMANNKTKQMIKSELLMFCDRIPLQEIQQECHNMVIADFDIIYQDIVNELNPDLICTALGLCKPSYQLPSDVTCELDGENACLDYVTAAKCNTINYCRSVVWTGSMQGNELCKCCTNDINRLREYLDSNTTREHVEADFLAMCKLIPWQEAKFKCQTAVLYQFERIYQDFINHLNASIICRAMFLCQNAKTDKMLAEDECSVGNACSDYETAKKCGILWKCPSLPKAVKSGDICRLCIDEMKGFQDWLKNGVTRSDAEKELKKICGKIPLTAFKNECLKAVVENFENIYDDMIAMVDPATTCAEMRLCNKVSEDAPSALPSDDKPQSPDPCVAESACVDYTTAQKCGKITECKATFWSIPAVEDDSVCNLCKSEITVLQDWLKSDPVKSQVLDKLQKFCNGIPLTAFRNEDPAIICTGMKLCSQISVEKYVTGMVDKLPALLKKSMAEQKLPMRAAFEHNCDLSTKGACHDITTARICNMVEKCEYQVWNKMAVKDDDVCDACKQDVKNIQMNVNHTREEVRRELNALCNKIKNPTLKADCLGIVKKDLDIIYNLIIKSLSPDAICAALRLCTAIGDTVSANIQQTTSSCQECESFFDDLQNAIFNNKNILESVLGLAKTRCESLDGNGAQCDMVAYQMSSEHHREQANPKAVCKRINMCDAYRGQRVGDMCTDCKTFFKEFQEELKNNPDEINQLVAEAAEFYCLQKPVQMRAQCTKYVSMVIKVLLEQMETEDVGRICTKIQFCDEKPEGQSLKVFAQKLSKLLMESVPKREKIVGGEPCADCKAFIGDLQTASKNNKTLVTELVDLVEAQCKSFGELASVCVSYVKDHYQEVIQQFDSYDVTTICTAMRMCTALKKKPTDGDICADCKAFVGDWQYIIANNQTIVAEDLSNVKQYLCSQVPFFLKEECDSVFDKESALIIKGISTQTPEQTCSDLDFCSKGDSQTEMLTLTESKRVEVPKIDELSPVCEVCEAVMKYVDGLINYNSTEKEVEDALLSACSHLPKYSQQCDAFIKKYAPTIIKLIIEDGTNPRLVCMALGLCLPGPTGTVTCEVCEAVMRYVDTFINVTSTEAEVVKVLDEVCDKIGSKYSEKCKKFIGTYGRMVIDLIIKEGTSPTLVCKALFLCRSQGRPSCIICHDIMAFVDDHIDEQKTEAKIIEALDSVCSHLKHHAPQCTAFVERYAKYIIHLIIHEGTDPNFICHVLWLCPRTAEMNELEALPNKAVPKPKDDDVLCDLCTQVAQQLDRMLSNNATQAEIKAALETVCNYLPGSFKTECDKFINDYFQMIVDILVKEMNPKVLCVELHLCPGSPVSRVHGAAECDVCLAVFTEVEKLLGNNNTEEKIVEVLDKVCNYLGKYKDECLMIINEYGPTLIHVLAHEVSPSEICKTIKLCPNKQIQTKPQNNDNPLCEVCTAVSKELHSILSDKPTQDEIEAALKKVCSILPTDMMKACDNLILTNWDKIIAFLLNESGEMCVQLHLCPAQTISVQDPVTCELCEAVMTYVDKFINVSSTEAEIVKVLDEVCDKIGSKYSAECKKFVETYGRMIIDLIIKEGTSPALVCKALFLCKSKDGSETVLCEICTEVAGKLDQMLSDKATQSEIYAALKSVCSLLPGDIRSECNAFIQDNFQTIVDFLVKEMNPKVLCVQLRVCPPSSDSQVKSSEDCQICEAVARSLDDLLKNNYTQAELEAALDEVCVFVHQDKRAICTNLMDQVGKELVKLLVAEMDPSVICTDLKVCPAVMKKTSSEKVCAICEVIAHELETLLAKNSTQAAIENALKKVCYLVPSKDRLICTSIITQYYQEFIRVLLEELNPSLICSDLKLCPGVTMQKVVESPITCELCKAVSAELDKLLSENATQAEIEKALQVVCNLLPSSDRAECDQLIEQYGGLIIQILVKEMNPSVLCKALKLCPTSVEKNKGKTSSEMVCEICKVIARELKTLVAKNSTQAAIENALKKVCYIVRRKDRQICNSIITHYYEEFFGFLLTELSPSVICRDVKLCPGVTMQKVVESPITCELCKAVSAELDKLLSENATQAEIEKALQVVCNLLPSSDRAECDQLIEQYGGLIIQILVKEMNPSVLCKALKLCPTSVEKNKGKRVKTFGECTVCKVIMDELEKVLSKQSTEEEILAAVNTVCNIVPQKYRAECHLYINDYGPGVISILVDDFVPSKVCTKLGACKSSPTQRTYPVMKMHIGDEKCSVCKQIIALLDDFLKQNYTEAAIEDALEKICGYVPPALKSECDQMIAQYAPIIFKYIDEIGDPSFICQHMDLCPRELKPSRLVGGNKCTYGPSYWCKNMETAKECNAVQHCKDHVWDDIQ